jgi:hypothetical protein
MTRSLPVPILALALACVSQPSAAQDASACLDEVGRLSASFPLTEQNSSQAGSGEAAGADIPTPSAEEADRELAQSGGVISPSGIGAGIDLDRPTDGAGTRSAEGPIAMEPGARRGASLGDEQRQQIRGLMDEARTAGERGDGQGCVQRLAEARNMLRQTAIGSTQPGGAGGGAGATATGETATGGTAGSGTAGGISGDQGGRASTLGRGDVGAGGSGSGTSAIGPGGGTGTTGTGTGTGGTSGGVSGGTTGSGSMGGGSTGGSSGGGSSGGGG